MCLNYKWLYKKGNRKETTYSGKEGDYYEIAMYTPCGRCEQCLAAKSNNWVVRNYYEAKKHKEICFITLTYDNENNIGILRRRDVQLFFKRLRKNTGAKIRYFGCGEYGEKRKRPHYHAILYGYIPPDLEYLDVSNKNNILYDSDIIRKAWKMGRITVQRFNQSEIPYISLYNTDRDETKKEVIRLREDLKEKINQMCSKFTEDKTLFQRKIEIQRELEEKETKWKKVKEFNFWSKSIGWSEWEWEHDRRAVETWQDQIGEYSLITPLPWVKKLANQGDYRAIKEIERRVENASINKDDLLTLEKESRTKINRAKEAFKHKETQQDDMSKSLNRKLVL